MPAMIGSHEERQLLQQMQSQYDAPAYVRRARAVQGALDDLLARCRKARTEALALVGTRLGQLRALAGAWEALRPHLADPGLVEALRALHDELQPKLRMPLEATTAARALRAA